MDDREFFRQIKEALRAYYLCDHAFKTPVYAMHPDTIESMRCAGWRGRVYPAEWAAPETIYIVDLDKERHTLGAPVEVTDTRPPTSSETGPDPEK